MSATLPPASVRPAPAASDPIEFKRVKAIFVGSIGNLVEWYDFYAYSAFALYFASSFFPKEDPTAQMLSTAGIFALGFITSAATQVLSYYFGSSQGSKDKDLLKLGNKQDAR